MLLAFAAGTVTGTVVSLLYASKSGAEVRKNIKNQSRKLAGAVQNKFKDVNGKIDEIKTGIRQSIDQLKDSVMA